jgi:hypothetical protein
MKYSQKNFARPIAIAVCALLSITFAPRALTQSEDKGKNQQEAPTVATQSLRQSVIAAGGGKSESGSFRVEGTIGQAVADTSTGGPYSVEGGFWPGAALCPIAILPQSQFFNMSGGSGMVVLTASLNCNWVAAASVSWITFTSKSTGTGNSKSTGTGNGTVDFEVRENFTGSARQGVISVGEFTQIIVQNGGAGGCSYTLSPLFAGYGPTGGAGTINLTATGGCAWQAVSSDGWVTFTSATAGIGNGAVSYVVAANASATGRNATITIGGKTFNIKQKGN